MRCFGWLVLVWLLPLAAWGQPQEYVWTSQSRNSSESMPLGGGDLGLNVWVEGGELLFYVCRSGSYDEHNTLLKAGRVRLRIEGGDASAPFRQTLRPADGSMQVELLGATVTLRVDAFDPVVRVSVESPRAVVCEVSYENWRYRDRPYRKGEGRQSSHKWAKADALATTADTVIPSERAVLFYHRNPAETVFDRTVEVEGLEAVKGQLWNPLAHRISGGRLWSRDLRYAGVREGRYLSTDFRAWRFRSAKPMRRQSFALAFATGQTERLEPWMAELEATVQRAEADPKGAGQRTAAWWRDYWQRSFIEADSGPAAALARNYTLFRYMLGCNRRGADPTKFNGGLFTFDPEGVDTAQRFTPDFRNWGGGTMTAQNQRLVYWPMLRSGDFDLLAVQFDFYERMRANAELRTRHYWGHEGASFTEQIELFGLPNYMEYGTKRPAWFDRGVEYNAWLEYCWDTVLEFCQMILESYRYDRADIGRYVPLIESSLRFFDEHYRYLAARRGRRETDGGGKLVLFPGSGCETYKMTYNASSTVAGLRTVLETYLDVKRMQGDTCVAPWRAMLDRIPALPLRTVGGREMIAPAVAWERINNVETPQLYPVFPWRRYTMASEGPIDAAVNTYLYDEHALKQRSSKGWKQDCIWAAELGQTEDAARLVQEKLADGPHRFPAFWGPGFDWTPDHNWGGSGAIALQEMLMQTDGDRIVLFPAWPQSWDVRFRLHAPNRTTVEAELRGGRVVRLDVQPEERRRDVRILLKNE